VLPVPAGVVPLAVDAAGRLLEGEVEFVPAHGGVAWFFVTGFDFGGSVVIVEKFPTFIVSGSAIVLYFNQVLRSCKAGMSPDGLNWECYF